MRKLILVIILVCVTCFSQVASVPATAAGDSIASIFQGMEDADARHTYRATGTTSIRFRRIMVTSDIRIYHASGGRSRIEYLTPPLKGLVVGNDGTQGWRLDPKIGKVVPMERPSRRLSNDKLALLLRTHDVEIADPRVIADRQTNQFLVKSKRGGQIRKRLWVDKDTSVVLASEDRDLRGRLMSSTEFRSIEFTDSLPASLFEYPKDAAPAARQFPSKPMSHAQLSKVLDFQVSIPRYVPAGYRLDGYRLFTCPHSGRRAAFTRYTNGLEGISLFEALRDASCKDDCCRRQVRDCMVREGDRGKVLTISARGRDFVIIADLNRVEIRKIAASLR